MNKMWLCLLSLLLVGCADFQSPFVYESPYGYTGDCAPKMDERRTALGAPEEVNTYSDSGYYSVDWWYWSRGVSYGFTWGSYVTGCKTSTYTFSPIH